MILMHYHPYNRSESYLAVGLRAECTASLPRCKSEAGAVQRHGETEVVRV